MFQNPCENEQNRKEEAVEEVEQWGLCRSREEDEEDEEEKEKEEERVTWLIHTI